MKTVTKNQFYPIQSQSQSKGHEKEKVILKAAHTHASKVTYFGSSKANVPLQVNLNVFRDIPEQISMITTPPPIPSDEMNHLKKKKVTNCSIWKSESESINLNRLQRPCVILKQTTQHLDCPGGKNRAHYIPLASIYNVFNKTATI